MSDLELTSITCTTYSLHIEDSLLTKELSATRISYIMSDLNPRGEMR